MSGAAARTGSLKEINNNKNMDSMRKRAGEFQKRTNKTAAKNKNLNYIDHSNHRKHRNSMIIGY